MVYEDVHWSDATTREFLDLLVDRVSGLGVLVMLIFRPEFNPPWIGRPHVNLLSLKRLPPLKLIEPSLGRILALKSGRTFELVLVVGRADVTQADVRLASEAFDDRLGNP
jgi:hypothetical protein